MQIRFLGHAAFELSDGDTTVLIDPFLTGNPLAAVKAEDLSPDAILLTHGHIDHFGDTVGLAKRTNAHVVAVVEIANELSAGGLSNVHDPNIGGTVSFDWGWVRLVPAWHTSTTATRRCSPICHSSAGAMRSTWRWCASVGTTRWTASTRWRPAS
jgi:L-ascorbate metabolism protein UlaG (beta-lactamase superfamily)